MSLDYPIASWADAVEETTATTGTGTWNLAGATTNHITFASLLNGKTVVYFARNATEYERGWGVVTAGSPDTLTRLGVLQSSNSNAAVSFTTGPTIRIDAPADLLSRLIASARFLDAPPVSPSAFDDEFTGASLDPKWTSDLVASASGVVSTFQWNGTWYTLASPGAASNNETRFHQALSGFNAGTAVMIIAKLSLSNVDASVGTVIFSVGTSATLESGSFCDAYLQANGHTINAGKYDGAAVNLTLGEGIRTAYLAFQRNAANAVRVMVSIDGIGWDVVDGPTTRAWNAAFLHVVLRGGTASNPTVCGIDWIRVNDPRFQLPPI